MMEQMPTQKPPAPRVEREVFTEPIIPRGWTYLKHGSNAVAWQSVNPLKSSRIVLDRPLSVVEQEDYARDRARDGDTYDTTRTYSSAEGRRVEGLTAEQVMQQSKPIELRVLFYQNHARSNRDPEFRASLDAATMKLIGQYYFDNRQQGRHPLVPSKTELIRLGTTREGEREVAYFIPAGLADAYRSQGGIVPEEV